MGFFDTDPFCDEGGNPDPSREEFTHVLVVCLIHIAFLHDMAVENVDSFCKCRIKTCFYGFPGINWPFVPVIFLAVHQIIMVETEN